jgi:hypothetical protein
VIWRAIILLPVWLITLLAKPFFRRDHPWRTQRLTLKSWAQHGTPMAVEFGFVFWVMGLCLLALLIRLKVLHG